MNRRTRKNPEKNRGGGKQENEEVGVGVKRRMKKPKKGERGKGGNRSPRRGDWIRVLRESEKKRGIWKGIERGGRGRFLAGNSVEENRKKERGEGQRRDEKRKAAEGDWELRMGRWGRERLRDEKGNTDSAASTQKRVFTSNTLGFFPFPLCKLLLWPSLPQYFALPHFFLFFFIYFILNVLTFFFFSIFLDFDI